jgi:hypothetical protein
MPKDSKANAGPKVATSSTKGDVADFVDLTKRYVLQETLGPLSSMGRTLLFGSAAAIMFGLASVLALIGVLRVLQTETGHWFTGKLTWIPYLLTIAAGLIIIGFTAAVVLRSPKATSGPTSEMP